MAKVLFLSNLDLATGLENPEAYKGLAHVMPNNLDAMIVEGAPARLPDAYQRRKQHYFQIMVKDILKKYGEVVFNKIVKSRETFGYFEYDDESLDKNKRKNDKKFKKMSGKEKIMDEQAQEKLKELQEFQENNKTIDKKTDMVEIGRYELHPLIKKAKSARILYVAGWADYYNVEDDIGQMMVDLRSDNAAETLQAMEELESTRGSVVKEQIRAVEKELSALKKRRDQNKGDDIDVLENKLSNLRNNLKDRTSFINQLKNEVRNANKFKMTKHYKIGTEEYMQILDSSVSDYYRRIILPMFDIGNFDKVYRYVSEDVKIGEELFEISYDRGQAQGTGQPLISSIQRGASATKMKTLREEGRNIPDVIVNARGKGGFKVYVEKKPKSFDPTYLIQLPPFWDEDYLKSALNKMTKTWHTGMYDKHFASGAVLYEKRKDKTVAFDFYSQKLLKDLYNDENIKAKMNGKPLKIEVISDTHIGAPNDLKEGRLSNYELMDAIMYHQRKNGLPNILVMGGDMLHGLHRNEIVSDFAGKVPMAYEKDMAEGNKTLSMDTLRQNLYGKLINGVDYQVREFKLRYVPYIHEVLANGGEVVIVSGNHYGKSYTFPGDEATAISNLIDIKYENQIHTISGSANGAGSVIVKGLNIYGVHKSRSGSDEVDGLMNHLVGAGEMGIDFAFSGDKHRPGIGHANNIPFVTAPGLQPIYAYVKGMGKSEVSRGVINAYLQPGVKGYTKFEFVMDDALNNAFLEGVENGKITVPYSNNKAEVVKYFNTIWQN